MTRRRALRRVARVVFVVNCFLLTIKAIVWYQSGSLAVGSEAVNSLTDVGYSLVILAGLYATTQPPDTQHPHGHERIEPFVSLFVAAGILLASALILWYAGSTLISGEFSEITGPWAVIVLVVAGVMKLWLYRYCFEIGDQYTSPALIATAIDHRNDVLLTAAALVGVIGAQLGYAVLDPLAAIVVAIGIGISGIVVVRENINYLVGGAPPDHLHEEIVSRALAHPEVNGVHDVIAHYVGPEIDVSIHVEVEGDLTLLEAHQIESAIIQSIREIDDIDDVYVHVDPKELGEWKEGSDPD